MLKNIAMLFTRLVCFNVVFNLLSACMCATLVAGEVASQSDKSVNQLTQGRLAQEIDRHIVAGWKEDGIEPTVLCSDAEFVRRVYLDLLGRIPKVAETRAFMESAGSSTRRERLVRKLIGTPAAQAQLASQLRRVWLPQVDVNPDVYHLGVAFEEWILERLRDGKSYAALVQELLTVPLVDREATGSITAIAQRNAGAIAYYQINDFKVENLAGASARALFGLRLECAQCHKHPFDNWTQDQFWQIAAFFTSARRLSAAQMQSVAERGRLKVPQTERYVTAAFLNEQTRELQTAAQPGEEPREAFAEWATAPENPYFAKNICNRVWAMYMGRGLVHPVDDVRPDNPASHPALLNLLAEEFIAHGYDLAYLVQSIINTKAYQRSSAVAHSKQFDPTDYACAIERPLSAEQLWNSLATATGYQNRIPHAHRGIAGLDSKSDRGSYILSFLGAPDPESPQMSMTHALKLMQGEFVSRMTSPKYGPVVAAVSAAPFLSMEEKIETIYLAALSRLPSSSERQRAIKLLKREGPTEEQPERLGNLLWALLNSSEFLLNH